MIRRLALALAFGLAALPLATAADTPKSASAAKKVVFIAGGRSHAYGQHAFKAGCELLRKGSRLPIPARW